MENVEDGTRFDKNSPDPSSSAVNNLILDYYKKFGRKRDLEQFFSLSTAQSEIRDPTGTFWSRMKSQNDSSDGEKRSESSTELCRISIKCSVPEQTTSQKRHFEDHQNSDSESPPIITEDVAPRTCTEVDEESVKSDDGQSQRSNDATLDLSMNKPHSPTSSITSQRKLEWDSLADVGYANEGDRKNSASSLSTLERLALKQQYSHNDSKQNIDIGLPTSQSTPVEETESKMKSKKGLTKKSTKIYQKDMDYVELNIPHSSQSNLPQAISVNLSKQICFNVENDGNVNIGNIKKNISVSPEKNVETEKQAQNGLDKEIQTSLTRHTDKSSNLTNISRNVPLNNQKFPVLISLNTLKKRNRKRKLRVTRKKLKNKNKLKPEKEHVLPGKAVEQVSEAESFEYMPGHIYNQNHMKVNQSRGSHVGNKSSLESSTGLTTDSSKCSKRSFTNDFEKSVDILKTVLQQHNNDSTLKKKLIKEVVARLIKSKYRDDGSSTDFLSGLSIDSKKMGGRNHTTTSTSDTNNTGGNTQPTRPKKSILRTDKFNSNALASTSQSAPNLPSVSNSEKPLASNLTKPILFSNTDSDISNKDKNCSDLGMPRTSSEVLYKKYVEAVRREQAYKHHLRAKESFLKQKFVCSETAINQLAQADLKTQNKLKNLLKDLTRNNYNDGSGDASKLEGFSYNDVNDNPYAFFNKQRSHSVFTLSSGNSDTKNKNPKLKNIIKSAMQNTSKAGCSKNEHHYCCCPYHTDHTKVGFTDSSVQVNIKSDKPTESSPRHNTKYKKESPRNITRVVSEEDTGDLKYVCVCSDEGKTAGKVVENFLIYKCSRLVNKSVQLGDTLTRNSNIEDEECKKDITGSCKCGEIIKNPNVENITVDNNLEAERNIYSGNFPQKNSSSKSSQTNLDLNLMMQRKSSTKSFGSQFSASSKDINMKKSEIDSPRLFIREAIRSVQTDISINPKLSDPGMCDINIIDERECVKLIREQHKEVSKQSSENNTEDHLSDKKLELSSDSTMVTPKDSFEPENKQQKTMSHIYTAQADKEVQSDIDHGTLDNFKNENYPDEFTIPIQGTNMTLKVNLGTQDSDKGKSFYNSIKSQGVVTEKLNVMEQFTSLREDCTKSVQCCDANIFQPINQNINEDSRNQINNEREQTRSNVNNQELRTCLVKKPECNTYPKEEKVRKPFLRTNTDTSNFEKLGSVVDFEFKNYDTTSNQRELPKKYLKGQPATSNNQNQASINQCSTCSNQTVVCEQPTMSNNLNKTVKYTTNKGISFSPLRTNGTTENYTNVEIINDPKEPKEFNEQDDYNKCTSCLNKVVNQLRSNQKPGEKCKTSDQPIKINNRNQFDKCKTCSNQNDLSPKTTKPDNENNTCSCSNNLNDQPSKSYNRNQSEMYVTCTSKTDSIPDNEEIKFRKQSKSSVESEMNLGLETVNDPLLDMIADITKRYSKKDIERSKRKKCFKEIMTVLNYLLDTEDSTDDQNKKPKSGSPGCILTHDDIPEKETANTECCPSKTFVDRGVQPSTTKSKQCKSRNILSEVAMTSDFPTTSTDSATCKVLNKIKRECEKYHQKRCKSHNGLKPCETSSTTSINCAQCKRVHHCHCLRHKCRNYKTKTSAEKPKKKCVAYNLILQTSDSIVSEEPLPRNNCPLKNVIVKVPPKRRQAENVPFKEMAAKFERNMPNCSPRSPCRGYRSRSLPNESEISSEDFKNPQTYTVREYLERNRPDFVEKCSRRQDCLKFINETRANERYSKRKLLSLQLGRRQALSSLTDEELRSFAKQLSEDLRRNNVAPKFISEHEMKKHSEKIYKSLPEVTRKKDELKKENIKKTNLLMANIFKKNLQKKTLRGSVNLSNYSTVIKI